MRLNLLFSGLLLSLPPVIAGAETHTFAEAGSAVVECSCTVGECGIKTGQQQFTWSLTIFAPKGAVNIDQMCYNKQNVDRGDGVSCCDYGAANTIGTHTTGKVTKECLGQPDKEKCH